MSHWERTINGYNLDKFDTFETDGQYDMPVLKAIDIKPTSLIGFNYVCNSKKRDGAVHFFLDDYQFERVWNRPELYLDKFREFEAIIAPDFSLYLDMPVAMQIWNCYRARLLAQWYQSQGVNVIPNITFSDKLSYDWCFDGMPENSTLAISSVGTAKRPDARELFKNGLFEAIQRLSPKRILFWGKIPEFDFGDLEVIGYTDKRIERMRKEYGR